MTTGATPHRGRRWAAVGAALALSLVGGIAIASATGDTATITSSTTAPPNTGTIAAPVLSGCTGANIYGQPFALTWPAAATVDHYEVVLRLNTASVAVVCNSASDCTWEDNANTDGTTTPAGQTWIPPQRYASLPTPNISTSAYPNVPLGATSPLPPTGSGSPGTSTTYTIPNVIGSTATTGIRWGLFYANDAARTFSGTVRVTAIGPNGWRSPTQEVTWNIRWQNLFALPPVTGSATCTSPVVVTS